MTRPSFARMVRRAVRRRCPWCGGRGAFFIGWFEKQPHCKTCGLRWRRDDVGFELGAATMAAMITIGPLVFVLGLAFVLAWPDPPSSLWLLVPLVGAVVLPIVMYPLSYTLWQAFDLTFRPVEPDDFDVGHIVGPVFDDL